VARLALQRRGRADEEGALVLGERRGDDVRAVVVAVDPAEVGVGVGLGDRAEGVAEGEADRNDQLVLGGCEGLEVRAAVVGGGGLELLNGDAEVGLCVVGSSASGMSLKVPSPRPPVSKATPRKALSSSPPQAAAVRTRAAVSAPAMRRLDLIIWFPLRAGCCVRCSREHSKHYIRSPLRVHCAMVRL
jgi:hypothetical protein